MSAYEIVLLPGSLETMATKTWAIRRLLREGAIDIRAALTSLRVIEACSPPALQRLAAKTIREVTSLQEMRT